MHTIFIFLIAMVSMSYAATPNYTVETLHQNISVGNIKGSCESCAPKFFKAVNYTLVGEETGDPSDIPFESTLPDGYLLRSVQVDVMCAYDCTSNSTRGSAIIQLGQTVVTHYYPFPPKSDSCDCISCHQLVSIPSDPQMSEWWSGFNYTGINYLQFIFIHNTAGVSFISLTFYIVNISPNITLYAPHLAPSYDGSGSLLTIMGSNFFKDFEYRCDFYIKLEVIYSVAAVMSEEDPPGSMTCQLPKQLDIRDKIVNASLWVYPLTEAFGQITFPDSIGPRDFQFYEQPILVSINPANGGLGGGTEVQVSGKGFFPSEKLSCAFGVLPVPATFISSELISCVSPEVRSTGPVFLAVTQNGLSWTNQTLVFNFIVPTPTVVPPSPLSPSTRNMYILLGGACFLLIIAVTVFGCSFVRRRPAKEHRAGYDQIRDTFDSQMIIPRDDILMKEVIGRGSFGSVYRALWRHTVVAVKKLDLDPNDILVTDLYEEAKLMISLRHPNVVTFMGVTLPPDVCIITEFVARGSLYSILHNRKIHIEWEHLRKFALDTCMGMAYLHAAKIIHRDLKTHNLLVDKGWNIKVCDFGMSRSIEERNKTMTACGTPCWTAPEVLRNQRYSFAADVYSFGICLWEMISREAPYGAMPPYQVVISVATKGMRPTIPEGTLSKFSDIIKTCWAEADETRPTFGNLVEILESVDTPNASTPFPLVVNSSSNSSNNSLSFGQNRGSSATTSSSSSQLTYPYSADAKRSTGSTPGTTRTTSPLSHTTHSPLEFNTSLPSSYSPAPSTRQTESEDGDEYGVNYQGIIQ